MKNRNMNNKILVSFFFVAVLVLIVIDINFVNAEKKLLFSPKPIENKADDYLNIKYKESLEIIKSLVGKTKNESINKIILKLYMTTRKDKALSLLKEMSIEIDHHIENGDNSFEEVFAILDELIKEVESGNFNNHRIGVDLEVDNENREYVLSWKIGESEVVKRTPFVPEMKLVVKGNYMAQGNNNDDNRKMVYKYWIENMRDSKAPFINAYLENKFTLNFIGEKVKSKYGRMVSYHKLDDDNMLTVVYPEGLLKYFSFYIYNSKTEIVRGYKPGDIMIYPYELEGFEGELPGVLKIFIPVAINYFNPHSVISPEDNPELAVVYLTPPKDNFTMYMYSGNTIGPYPIPESFNKLEFLEYIISMNAQSIEEGWNNKEQIIKFSNEGLKEIMNNPTNKKIISDFLLKLENHYKDKQLEPEAYVLLKYNLEYYLSKILSN